MANKTALDILAQRLERAVDRKEDENTVYYGEYGLTREEMREKWANEVIDEMLDHD